jgi:hypothetical protein
MAMRNIISAFHQLLAGSNEGRCYRRTSGMKREMKNTQTILVSEPQWRPRHRKRRKRKKTPGLSPPANYTDRTTAACRRS